MWQVWLRTFHRLRDARRQERRRCPARVGLASPQRRCSRSRGLVDLHQRRLPRNRDPLDPQHRRHSRNREPLDRRQRRRSRNRDPLASRQRRRSRTRDPLGSQSVDASRPTSGPSERLSSPRRPSWSRTDQRPRSAARRRSVPDRRRVVIPGLGSDHGASASAERRSTAFDGKLARQRSRQPEK